MSKALQMIVQGSAAPFDGIRKNRLPIRHLLA